MKRWTQTGRPCSSPSVLIFVGFVGCAALTACGGRPAEETDPATTDPATTDPATEAGLLAPAGAPLPGSMKGYELYSWKPAGEDWHFTLITGTNRDKSCAELQTGADLIAGGWVKITAVGVDALKQLLSRLPAGEAVFWSDARSVPGCDLALPGADLTGELRAYCSGLGVELGLRA